MHNGHTESYNQDWCQERHMNLDRRMSSVEAKFWAIILLLVTNLGGIMVILLTKPGG